jgi:hypothetical protein
MTREQKVAEAQQLWKRLKRPRPWEQCRPAFEAALDEMAVDVAPRLRRAPPTEERQIILGQLRRTRARLGEAYALEIAALDQVIAVIKDHRLQGLLSVDHVGADTYWTAKPSPSVSFTRATYRQALAALTARQLLSQWGAQRTEVTTSKKETASGTWYWLATILYGDQAPDLFQYIRKINDSEQRKSDIFCVQKGDY